MRDSKFVRRVCAIVFVAAIGQSVDRHLCRAAFLTVYGGPTYSQTTGGYQAANASYGRFTYGAVNDAGTAVGNVIRYDAPLSSTPENVYISVATWSATSSPVILSSGSSTTHAEVSDINDAGTTVGTTVTGLTEQQSLTSNTGSSKASTSSSAAQWTPPGTSLSLLPQLSANPSADNIAYAINSQGTAVGVETQTDSSGNTTAVIAVRWGAGASTATALDTLDQSALPQPLSTAYAVNNSGTAVGLSTRLNGGVTSYEAVRWDASSTAITMLGNLGTPAGQNSQGYAAAINDSGRAVGSVTKYSPSGTSLGSRAVRWDAGGTTATELGNLGTDANGVTQSYAVAINNAGETIGSAQIPGSSLPTSLAVRWDPGSTTAIELTPLGSTPTLLGTLPDTSASAINSSGIIVGSAETETIENFGGGPVGVQGQNHAVYWTPDNTVVDLNSLINPASGWTLTDATAISDTDWILGVGSFDPDGPGGQAAYNRLFLIQVPEPSSLVLLALGAFVLAWNFVHKVPAWQKPE